MVHIRNVPNSAFMSKEVLPYLPNANTNATLVPSSGLIGLYTVPMLLSKDGYRLTDIIPNNNDNNDSELAYANTVQVKVSLSPATSPPQRRVSRSRARGRSPWRRTLQGALSHLQARHDAGEWASSRS